MTESDINKVVELVKSLQLSRTKLKDIVINIFFLQKGLKPSILWDFGSVDISKLHKLQPLFKDKIVIIRIKEDIVLTLKTRIGLLSSQLNEFPPVIVDISSDLTDPEVLLDKDVINSLMSMMVDVETASTSEISYVDVPESWNVSTLFGLLLGFPFVYYYRKVDNCLGHKDLMLVRVRAIWENRTFTPISFSVPKSLWSKEGLETKVKKWWNKLDGSELVENLRFVKVKISIDISDENMPIVIL